MKKIFLLCVFTGCIMTGCIKGDPTVRLIDYIYVNNSYSEITVHSFRPKYYNENDNHYMFTIPVNGQHTVTYHDEDYRPPFNAWYDDDYLTVSNGKKTVTQKYAEKGELYQMESYTFISEEKWHKVVQYVFTDEFFANGVPVE